MLQRPALCSYGFAPEGLPERMIGPANRHRMRDRDVRCTPIKVRQSVGVLYDLLEFEVPDGFHNLEK